MMTPTESPHRIPIRPEMGMDAGEAFPTPNKKMTDSRPSRSTVMKQTINRPERCMNTLDNEADDKQT